ncbi:MAG: hypothetical protein JNL70_11570 [Saprospiraceae bacterium]|nr:hypothetical protein [Saprospiraceae bacterium]
MTSTHEQLKDLREIRSLMERSSRFIGLSGLSGIAAGLCALAGATATYIYIGVQPFDKAHQTYFDLAISSSKWGIHYVKFFIITALATILSAIFLGILFTKRHAHQKKQSIWDATAQRLLTSLAIPLSTGGFFCLALLLHGSIGYLAPATLVFYGLALVNGSKYTLHDVYYLGLTEIALGLVAMFMLRYGLEFWVIGFGVLHIVYGTMMYFKYERK